MQAACQGQLGVAFETEKTRCRPVNPEKTALQKSVTTFSRRERAAPLASRRAIAWQKMTKNRAYCFPTLAGELPSYAMVQVAIYTAEDSRFGALHQGLPGRYFVFSSLGRKSLAQRECRLAAEPSKQDQFVALK